MIHRQRLIDRVTSFSILVTIVGTIGFVLVLQSKQFIFSRSAALEGAVTPFPVSVNVFTKEIIEDPLVNPYFSDSLAGLPDSPDHWWNRVAATLAPHDWYQNLASPVSRIVVVWPGERREEAVKKMGDILGWSSPERERFLELMAAYPPSLAEGNVYPGQYVTHRSATPEEMAAVFQESFSSAVLARYTPEVAEQVPLDDALIIASLLEREASDFNNMREVAGVIWNRLFIGMPLQLDATLQYVRGSNPYEPSWWPRVLPQDKFTDSPFNTYQNVGLPPTPIANPSASAVLAALNPIKTDCLFYFHGRGGQYHCSETYEEHVSKLRSVYGRGS